MAKGNARSEMKIGRRAVPVINLAICFRRFDDEHPPYASIDVLPESDSETHGGVALNCINVGDLTSIEDLAGKEFSFDRDGETEIAESVFWRPPNDNLEIEHLVVKFGAVTAGLVEIDLRAKCFDFHGNSNIPITLSTAAKIVEG
jgi:hypothetical protein